VLEGDGGVVCAGFFSDEAGPHGVMEVHRLWLLGWDLWWI
jgi:hypothetical protein